MGRWRSCCGRNLDLESGDDEWTDGLERKDGGPVMALSLESGTMALKLKSSGWPQLCMVT